MTLANVEEVVLWLEQLVAIYEFDVIGLARRKQRPPYPLPTEPGVLGHFTEVTALEFLGETLRESRWGVVLTRGAQRKYPDAELTGGCLAERVVALDVKGARRGAISRRGAGAQRTQSRITLLTGNTYFARPEQRHPNILRPYRDYTWHLHWIILYDLDPKASHPAVTNTESIVAETWQVASRRRSSETRNYIGAVDSIPALRAKTGDFRSREEFENYWRLQYRGWRTTPGASDEPDTGETLHLL